MVEVLCIDDKRRPDHIPAEKWIVEGEIYRVNFITHVLPQNLLALSLYEKPLGEEFFPYEYFASERFLVPGSQAKAFYDYLHLCNEVAAIPVEQLIESFRLGK